ncbi:MAG TPA: carboxypeptidase-like regulatory domain-containing protein [Thermoanaerobaculia bacterium]|nr:carboxypeptidase-like regulatory domain-containing protein [Thermoanaerobaculia bacterium]
MRIILLLTLVLHVSAAMAAETVVTLERDGQTVGGGQVCRFPAGHRRNPIRRWLASQEVTCVAAGSPMAFPPGLWNVFARTADGVSTEPLLVDGAAPPSSLVFNPGPSALLSANLAEGRSAVVYVPRRLTALPLAGNTQRVPADEPLWLVVVEKKQPVSIFSIPPMEAGSERNIDARGTGVGPAIVAWLQFSDEHRAAIAATAEVPLPQVRVTQGGPALDSDPLPRPDLLDGALVLLRGVKAGEAEVDVGGRGWLPAKRRVNVTHAITPLNDPLLLRPSATLVVHWNLPGSMRELNATIGSCKDDEPPQLEIVISTCTAAPRRGPRPDPPKCEVLRKESVAPGTQHGDVTFEGLPPGMYRAEMVFGHLPPVSRSVRAAALQQADVWVQARFWDLYGSLTFGGEPLGKEAEIIFPSGAGFASEETSEYHAAVEELFETDAKIEVATCDGGLKAIVLAEGHLRPRSRYDVDIPDNALTIDVTDTFTRMPLPGAVVNLEIFSKLMPRQRVLERRLTTEADQGGAALATFVAVPEREVVVTVSHAGYQKQTLEAFTMHVRGERRMDVQLVPLRGSQGRIVSPRPFDGGSIHWFSAAGEETERAELWPDGTFVYANSHAPDETMAIVSRSHPLWALRAVSAARGQTLEIPFPEVPSRTFDVAFASGDRQITRVIGLVVRGLRIPQGALRAHQSLRDLPSVLRGTGPLPIRDLAETGPIDVLLGPRLEEVPHRVPDPFALPAYADVPRKRLEGESIEFD